MNCRSVQNLLPDYVADKLSADERALVSDHVERCTDCGREIETMRECFTSQRNESRLSPLSTYWQTIVPRIHERRGLRTPENSFPFIFRFLMPAAGIVAALFLLARIEKLPLTTSSDELTGDRSISNTGVLPADLDPTDPLNILCASTELTDSADADREDVEELTALIDDDNLLAASDDLAPFEDELIADSPDPAQQIHQRY